LKSISYFIICAGSRNIPVIERLSKDTKNRLIPHFDEREASFFALGLAKKVGQPVAVVCTSGTAVSECHSAVIEAFYSGIPLVIISADRPKRYRGTGAPQTIEQKNIFGNYIEHSIDVEDEMIDFDSIQVPSDKPSHINICIEDVGQKISTPVQNSQKETTSIQNFLENKKQPLVILGELSSKDQKAVEQFLLKLGAITYAEAPSGLRELKRLEQILIKGSDRVIKKALEKDKFDCVLRLGSIPTLRSWRDLDNAQIPVLSIDSKPFSGTPRGHLITGDISEILLDATLGSPITIDDEVKQLDARGHRELHRLLYEYPLSEPSLFYSLSHLIHSNDSIFLGNSLPIREWDLASSRKTAHPIITVQRGTNGIDGQLSHFFGNLDGNRHNWGIFGDLTTLYGLNSFWILKEFPSVPVTIIVINNNGGDIFRRLPQLKSSFKENPTLESLITNHHHLDFSNVAKMWGLDFERMTTFTKPLRTLGKSLIEVNPDPTQTNKFWDTWNTFWNSLR
jgi:2-succinyl-5-enolpyruvyl-6-hydroxy-3-cyclohexene-1-carboxylate synthase